MNKLNIIFFLILAAAYLCPQPTCAAAVSANESKTSSKPVLRLSGGVFNNRINSKGDLLAFTDKNGRNLRILEIKTKHVYLVSTEKVDLSFFWAPNGFRLFYKETVFKDNELANTIKAYDVKRKSSIILDRIVGRTGTLSFDPRDFRFYLLHEKGVLSKRLIYPDERLSRWQMAQRTDDGKWLIGANQITWLSNRGLSMSSVEGDSSGIQSFDISPDGSHIVWASKEGRVFISEKGKKAKLVSEGIDVSWHPGKPIFIFSKTQKNGTKIVGRDLAIGRLDGSVKVITATPIAMENTPVWLPDGKRLLYSNLDTTDLFLMDFR